MTDRPVFPGTPAPDETPEVAEVRRLLAQARHTEPMPGDVVDRMDEVLADLARGGPRSEGVAARIEPHRRRRATGRLLVAAAAVVVGGVVVAPHLSSDAPPASSSATQDAAGSSQLSRGNTGERLPEAGKAQGSLAPGSAPTLRLRNGRVVVRPLHFTTDALAARARLKDDDRTLGALRDCVDVPGGLDAVLAEYRHAPAALVFGRIKASTQVVRLYVCGDPEPIRSARLPAP